MSKHASKLQSTGILAGLLALLCLPCILAPLLISAGLSSVLVFMGQWFAPVLLILVSISLIGFFLSFRTHKNILPLAFAVLAGGLLFYSTYVTYNQNIGYLGAFLLIAAVIADYIIRRRYKLYCDSCEIKPTKKVK